MSVCLLFSFDYFLYQTSLHITDYQGQTRVVRLYIIDATNLHSR